MTKEQTLKYLLVYKKLVTEQLELRAASYLVRKSKSLEPTQKDDVNFLTLDGVISGLDDMLLEIEEAIVTCELIQSHWMIVELRQVAD